MRIDDAIDRFLRQLAADGRSHHTINQYRRHLRLFATWTAHAGLCGDLSKLDHDAIAAFLVAPQAHTSAHGGTKQASSVNCLRTSLKMFFGYLHRAGIIAEDPARLVRRANTGPPPPRTLGDDERAKLLGYLAAVDTDEGRRDHALVHLMLATGIRLSSAVNLDVEDVDLQRGEVQLRAMKGDRRATVYLGNAIGEHLRDYIGNRTSGPLFPARHGGRVSVRHVQRRFREIVKNAGFQRPASPHSLRHSMAQDLYNRTGDILLVKEALHHRSIASTMVYARPDEDRIRKALS